jgi:hypothetical protein
MRAIRLPFAARAWGRFLVTGLDCEQV